MIQPGSGDSHIKQLVKIAALIIGILLMVGSCVPVGTSIYRSFNSHDAYSQDIELGKEVTSDPFVVDTTQKVMVAVSIDVYTQSLQEETENNETTFEPRYRFPVKYSVYSATGKKLISESGEVDWKSGSKLMTNHEVVSNEASLSVQTYFKKFKVAEPGQITVHITVSPDTHYQAQARSVTLKVYDQVYDQTPLVLTSIGMFILGLVVVILSIILMAATQSRSADNMPATVSEGGQDLAMWCHLSALVGYFFPLGSIVAPLVIWLTQREEYPFVDQQGKEAVNFNLSIFLYGLVSLLLVFLLVGFILLPLLAVFHVVCTIVAAVKASQGEAFRYPLTIRLVT